MRLGKLTHLMTVQSATGRTNSVGEIAAEFGDGFEVWASLEPLSNAERERAAAVESSTTHRIGTHYDCRITNRSRLAYGDRRFDVVNVINKDEANVELVITASEVLNG